MGELSKRLPWLIEAIESHNSDSCLLWPFSKNKLGYGTMRFKGSVHLVHRVAFYLTNGHWPEPCGMHICDNPPCVSPRHIIAGTKGDNTRDAASKGRLKPQRGEMCITSKITADIVKAIRGQYVRGSSGEYGQAWLAKKYGIEQTTVSSILRRKSWRHLA